MKFLSAIFSGGLKLLGFAEQEISNIVGVGAFVRGLNLPPATHPGVYADILKIVGIAEDKIPQVQALGAKLNSYGSIIQELEGAQAEFQAGQEVTGHVQVGTVVYDYDFKPRGATQPGVVNAPPILGS